MKEMNNKLNGLYSLANQIVGEVGGSELECIALGAEILVYYEKELPKEIASVLFRCLHFINHNLDEDLTFSEWVNEGWSIIEDICGTLGEYLDNN